MNKINMGCGWRNFGDDWIHIDGGDYDHLDYKDICKLEFEDKRFLCYFKNGTAC